MATCKYCKQSAGLFSSAHKECETKHSSGMVELRQMIERYFQNLISAAEIQNKIPQLRRDNYLSADDVVSATGSAIDRHADSIRRPFAPRVVTNIVHLVTTIGEPYCVIDQNGAITRFAQKIIKGHIAEYFTGKQDIATTRAAISQVTSVLPVTDAALQEAYLYMLNKAADNYLKDGLLSPQEEQRVNTYINTFGIQTTALPAAYQNSNIAKLSQSAILANLQHGILPQNNMFVPIMLSKGETVLWQYDDVKCFEEKVKREYISNRGGISIKIAKGVYYRPSTGRTRPVEHNYMNLEGTGTLYITNKNLVFNSPSKGLKIPYTKIIGVTPYSDGLELNRDGNAKRIILQGFDSWFVMNLLSVVANS